MKSSESWIFSWNFWARTAEPDDSSTTRSKSWKMSERGWWTDSSTSRLPRARRDRVSTRLWAVKLSRPEARVSRTVRWGSSRSSCRTWATFRLTSCGVQGVPLISTWPCLTWPPSSRHVMMSSRDVLPHPGRLWKRVQSTAAGSEDGCRTQESFRSPSQEKEEQRNPAASCSLSVSSVSYTVSERVGPWWNLPSYRKRWTRQILNKVSFHVNSGEILGILGNSGSGKTTLLDAIAGRIGHSGSLSGDVFINGRKLKQEQYQDCFSYVLQVSAVMSELSLTHVGHTVIGGRVFPGISGGERRRVSIASQLLQDPKVILLDEPTTGLDSMTANQIVVLLAELARRDRIVIVTIHQPRSELFRVFSRIAIMSCGELVFCGQPGEMVDFFSQCGYEFDLTSVDTRSSEREAATFSRMHDITSSYQGSAIHQSMLGKMQQSLQRSNKAAIPLRAKSLPTAWPNSERTMRNLSRDRMGVLMRLSQNLIYGLFIAFFIVHLDNDVTKGAVQDRIGIIYQAVGASPYTGMLNAVALFTAMRAIGDQESQDGLYSKWQMFLAYVFHILPFSILSVFIFTSFLYWVVGMHPDTLRFLCFSAVVLVPHVIGELLTVVLLGIVQNPNMVNSGELLTVVLLGIVQNPNMQMPQVFQWLSYLTFQKYSCELLIVTEFHDLQFTCRNQIIDQGYPGALSRYTLDFVLLYTFLPALLLLGVASFKIRDRLIRR
ncbi:hypothetical protein CRUP_000554 [Coryphaenoides rupestris]|nr:hypothetical protein CRUP_000554 [Coryphaenoides rupestris]